MATKPIKSWWFLIIKGLILIALAFLIFKHTRESIMAISVLLGGGLILIGIILFLISLELKKAMANWIWRMVEGVLDFVFGFFLLVHPGVAAEAIPVFIGFWIILYGVLMLIRVLRFPDDRHRERQGVLIVAIITLILGLLVSFNPTIRNITMGILIGLPVLLIGLANLFFAFSLRRQKD